MVEGSTYGHITKIKDMVKLPTWSLHICRIVKEAEEVAPSLQSKGNEDSSLTAILSSGYI